MRRVISVIWLVFLLVGCYSLPVPPISEVPYQWAVDELVVRLPYEMTAGDPQIELAKKMCSRFNERLYDAFNGQIRIKKFSIVNPSLQLEVASGTCNLFEDANKSHTRIVYRNEGYLGNPSRPGRFYCQIAASETEIDERSGTIVHEWCHSWLGLLDEYKHDWEPGNIGTTTCPKKPADSYCVMCDSRKGHKLCNSLNHNPDTNQGEVYHVSCFEYAAATLAKYRLVLLQLPKYPATSIQHPYPPIITVTLQ